MIGNFIINEREFLTNKIIERVRTGSMVKLQTNHLIFLHYTISYQNEGAPKMYDFIQIGAWRSDQVPDLHVLSWDAPLMPRAGYAASPLPGMMTSVEAARRDWKPENISVTLAIIGSSRADIRTKYKAISRVLFEADHLILSDMPGYHYRGYTQEIRPAEDMEEWLSFRLTFVANPPCLLRTLGTPAGWIPSPATPIAEQITELNASHNLHLNGPQQVVISDGLAAYPPEVYMLLIGSWDSLRIGGLQGLTIPGLGVTSGVWLDASAQQVYDKVAGVRTPVPDITGDYAAIGQSSTLDFDGTNLNLTAHILVIERS